MVINKIQAKTILRKHKKIDSWFISRYGMNLYRGCTHNCVYCDGRSEKYQVDGEFGKDISVKTNAIEILKKELDPSRKRKPMKSGFIMLGGGVGDTYQEVEKKYELSRKTLELILKYNHPVHILTKSTLVKKDIDLIKKINKKTQSIVSFSFSSTNDNISSTFEPGVPSPTKRLETISLLKNEGIPCGMFLLPVIPFLTDTPKIMKESIKKAKETNIDFIIFGGMTLKDGRQKDYFLDIIHKNYPEQIVNYSNIYKYDKWGSPVFEYINSINKTFNYLSKKYNMQKRVPYHLFKKILSENDLVIVILEHIDYLLKLEGLKSPYGFAAYSISKLSEPLSSIKNNLRQIKGVGSQVEKIILEILDTKRSTYYEKLVNL